MYTPTSAPLPPNSQQPPSAADVARYKRTMASMGAALDKARTDWRCSWQAAISTQPIPTQIPGLLPVSIVTVPGRDTTKEQLEAAQRTANALLMPNLTDEQRDAIANAPKVLSTPGPCPPIPEEKHCPANVAAPVWGNSTIAYPPNTCPSLLESAKKSPWTAMLLVVGGVIALDWLTE